MSVHFGIGHAGIADGDGFVLCGWPDASNLGNDSVEDDCSIGRARVADHRFGDVDSRGDYIHVSVVYCKITEDAFVEHFGKFVLVEGNVQLCEFETECKEYHALKATIQGFLGVRFYILKTPTNVLIVE